MRIDRWAILPSAEAPLVSIDRIYDDFDEMKKQAKPGEALVELHFELKDAILVEVVP